MPDDTPAKPRNLCGSGRKNTDAKCTRPAGWGTDHPGTGRCKLHGGNTPNGRVFAQKQIAEQAVVTFGLPREVDPHTALLEEVWRTAGHVAWLQAKVAELDADDLAWGVTVEHERNSGEHPGTDVTRQASPSIWLSLYQSERAHLVKVAAAAIAAGVAERQVRIAEQQGALINQVLRGVLADLGVLDHPQAPAIVRKHLGLVAGGES